VSCDDIRELLSEHVLGTLDPDLDRGVRRHVRGCASCRAEMQGLGEGLTQFARAVHDREPPPDLRERVLTVLQEEWGEDVPGARSGRWRAPVTVAATVAIVLASLAFARSADRRAQALDADATSYRTLLEALGGKEFRVGSIHGATHAAEVEGSVVLYDSHEGQSWGVVLVRAPGHAGKATASLETGDGRAIEVGELAFGADGDAATWIVTGSSLEPYDHLTVRLPDGSVLATSDVRVA
jgi:Putative zinc-finger